MLNKKFENYGVMGFVEFEKLDNVACEEVIEASLNWQREFLKPIEGIGFHCLLGNLKGGFADLIFGTNKAAFEHMSETFLSAASSQKVKSLLDPQSIVMRSASILADNFTVPDEFSCVEAGFMRANKEEEISEAVVREKSINLEKEFLGAYANTKGHFVGKTAEDGFCEVTFGQTLGQTREICFGYEAARPCREFLSLFDEKSFEFDFWYPLA